jgi:hypothetical protein
VLFVDDDERQPSEAHTVLKERMRPYNDGHLLTGGNRVKRQLPCAPGQSSRQERYSKPERLEPALKILMMLFGKEFRGSHEGHLKPRLNGRQRGKRGDERLARAYVTLYETQHWRRTTEV